MEKLDAILSSSSIDAFDLLTSDVEDLKITICADAFITLLQTIAERFASALLSCIYRIDDKMAL